MDVAERVPASQKLGAKEAKSLIQGATKIYVAKGKQLDEFAGGSAKAEIVEKMLGSTGNLRAPTIRVGKTLLVGFNEEVYSKVLG